KETERLLELDGKLPSLLSGKERPAYAAETLEFAHLRYTKKLHGAWARFCRVAFQAHPALADDIRAQHRYNAACAAALAGCGPGKDDPPLGETAKAHWRDQRSTGSMPTWRPGRRLWNRAAPSQSDRRAGAPALEG